MREPAGDDDVTKPRMKLMRAKRGTFGGSAARTLWLAVDATKPKLDDRDGPGA